MNYEPNPGEPVMFADWLVWPELQPKKVCLICLGEGTITLPAQQIGGEMRDGATVKCECQLKAN